MCGIQPIIAEECEEAAELQPVCNLLDETLFWNLGKG